MLYRIFGRLVRLHRYNRARRVGIRIPIAYGSWAIGMDDLLIVANELNRYRQRGSIKVLEFGSGVSTFAIYSYLQRNFHDFKLYSVEAKKEWVDKVKSAVVKNHPGALESRLALMHEEYVNVNGCMTFDVSRVRATVGEETFDVILIDAPPDTNGEDVRMNLCLEVLDLLNARGTLMVHDTNRINELYLYERLKSEFICSERFETDKGIGVLRFKNDGRVRGLS